MNESHVDHVKTKRDGVERPENIEVSLIYKLENELKIEVIKAIKINQYYQIKSIPVFAGFVAYDDIIEVDYEDGRYYFEDLIESSGHSFVHLIVYKETSFANIFATLATYGLGLNYLHNNLYIVLDIPLGVDYKKLKNYFLAEQANSILDFKEACLSDQHRQQIS